MKLYIRVFDLWNTFRLFNIGGNTIINWIDIECATNENWRKPSLLPL